MLLRSDLRRSANKSKILSSRNRESGSRLKRLRAFLAILMRLSSELSLAFSFTIRGLILTIFLDFNTSLRRLDLVNRAAFWLATELRQGTRVQGQSRLLSGPPPFLHYRGRSGWTCRNYTPPSQPLIAPASVGIASAAA